MKLNKINIAIMTALVGSSAASFSPLSYAETSTESHIDDAEVIAVVGYRKSLKQSQFLKQEATGTQESILSEDIGDFPDLNLAESLQRIPGVSISRDSGEGRQISLRGLGPNFTRTRLNGMEALFVTDSGIDQRGGASRTRDFDFSVFASELFNRVDVLKSYEAKQDEGGIAGTVDLYTAKPFDYDDEGWNGVFSAKGLYNDRNDSTDPRFAALVSNRWDNFGALFSAAYSTVDTIEEGYHVWSWKQASFGADNVADSVDAAVADLLINAEGADRVFVPRANNIASWANTRERLGLTAAFQWQPADRLSMDLDLLYGELSNDRIENQLSTAGTNAFTGDVNKGQLLTDAEIHGDNLVYAQFDHLDLRTESKVSYSESTFTQLSLNTNYELSDRLVANLLLGYSDSDFDMPIHDKVFAEAADHTVSIDWRSGNHGHNNYDFDVTDESEWNLMRSDVREDSMDNSYGTAKLDLSYEVMDDHYLMFGVHYKEYESSGWERRNRVDWLNDPDAPDAVFQQTAIPVLSPYAIANNQATFERLEATGKISRSLDESHNRPGTVYDIEEDTLSLYAQYEWRSELMHYPVRGNIGVRWVETDQVSAGEVQLGADEFDFAEFNNDYTELLPSLNVVVDLNDDLLARLGLNRNLSRPGLNQLRAAAQVQVADQSINAGNPNLEPFIADSLDLSLEYYSDNLTASLAYFYKDMEGFIVQQSQTMAYKDTGYPLAFLDFDPRVTPESEFTVSQPVNSEDAYVQGVELSLQFMFEFLPEPWNNLGFNGNLTYADGETTIYNEGQAHKVAPPGLSEWSNNVTLFYETDTYGVRVSSSYRDEFITGEGASQNIVAGYEETLFVDFKAHINLTDSLKISLEGTNLTDEAIVQFLDDRTQSYTQSGRNFILGVNYAF